MRGRVPAGVDCSGLALGTAVSALSALLLVGCISLTPVAGSLPPSSAPVPTPEPTSSASAQESPDSTPPPSPTPESPTATAGPEGLQIRWRQRRRDPGFGYVTELTASAAANGRAVVLTEGEELATRIFSTADGRAWDAAALPSESVVLDDVVAAGPGFIAVGTDYEEPYGAVSYTSIDGQQWQRFDIPLPFDTFSGATHLGSRAVVATSQGLIVSDDGQGWRSVAAPPGPGPIIELGTNGPSSIAFTGGGTDRVEVWLSNDGEAWQPVGQLPDSRGLDSVIVAGGPLGWVAIGASFRRNRAVSVAWFSDDGQAWRVATGAPSDITDVDADAAGFIAVGHFYPPGGCVVPVDQPTGTTWTSVDGSAWLQMPEEGWYQREVDQLLLQDRTLFGIGLDWTRDGANGSIWTAELPPISAAGPTPAATPSPPPVTGGC